MAAQKKFRFGERRAAAPSADMVLTQEDEQNLDAYVAKIKETVTLLRHEISAIKNGELETVGNVFDEKSKILKWIELRTPLIEPFLHHDAAKKRNLAQHLADLKQNIEEDGALLSRMAIAAKTIMREVEKINNRNGLGGIYGKSGQKLGGKLSETKKIDQQL